MTKFPLLFDCPSYYENIVLCYTTLADSLKTVGLRTPSFRKSFKTLETYGNLDPLVHREILAASWVSGHSWEPEGSGPPSSPSMRRPPVSEILLRPT